jgi:hypothetical protein
MRGLGHEGFDYFPYRGKIRSGTTETFELTFIDPTKKFIPLKVEAINLAGKVIMSATTQIKYRSEE